jgi:hexosaminidase
MAADVIRELASLAPGPYLHLGGDEVSGYTEDEYAYFMELTASVAADEGKTVVGWHDIGASDELPIGTVGQYWGPLEPDGTDDRIRTLLDRAGAIVMSPPEAAYLDQVYPDDDRLGLDWAGPTSVEEAYDWDPADVFDGVGDEQILGIEGPLWTETAATVEDVEFLAFPRLGALAELGWSPAPAGDAPRSFDEFGPRLVAFLAHFDALGVAYHRSGDLPW